MKYFHLWKDLRYFLPGRTPSRWEQTGICEPNKPTVILVPGLEAQERTVSVLRKRLLKDGFNVIVLSMDWLALADGIMGLYHLSKRLSSVVTGLRKEARTRDVKIFLVGHSAGGLVARHYVQMLGGSAYCNALVTMGTPHRGTWMALLGFLSHLILKARCLFQMLPGSPFIRALNQAPLPKGFKVVSIYSKGDPLCPDKSTRLPTGEGVEVENVEIAAHSHADYLLSKQAYVTLVERLGFRAPLPVVVSTPESSTQTS